MPDFNTYCKIYQAPYEKQQSLNVGAMRFEKRPSDRPEWAKVGLEYNYDKILSAFDELSTGKKLKCFVNFDRQSKKPSSKSRAERNQIISPTRNDKMIANATK